MVRILMLPGHTQSASIFRARLGAIRRALGTGADAPELVFVDPTFILDVPTTSSADFDSSVDPASASLADRPRTWWFSEARDGQAHYRRLDETLEYLRGILENEGPFDGCWGFSQGAAMAGILTLLVENPALHPVFAAPATHGSTNWPPPQFKFAILGAGFEPQDSVVKPWFTQNSSGKASTPSLHVLGRGDTIVGEERSVPLTRAFRNPRVEWHEGGHHTPSRAQWRRFFCAYLAAFNSDGPGAAGLDAIPSPGDV